MTVTNKDKEFAKKLKMVFKNVKTYTDPKEIENMIEVAKEKNEISKINNDILKKHYQLRRGYSPKKINRNIRSFSKDRNKSS